MPHGTSWYHFADEISMVRAMQERMQLNNLLSRFLQDDQGQDLIEYTLLLAFVCLASAALFISAGGSVSGIWSATNSRLAAANTSAS
jgi:Flp pilus assembly pilin Flp